MGLLRSPVAWIKAHPTAADTALGVLLAVVGLISLFSGGSAGKHDWRDPDAFAVLLLLASTVPLAVRRSRPETAFVLTLAGSVLVTFLDYGDGVGGVGALIALYSVATHCPPSRSLRALVLALAGVSLVMLTYPGPFDITSIAANVVIFVTAWALGNNLRTRRAYTAELEARARHLEDARAADARMAVNAERRRIARELHDLVAHNVSVMVVQAAAARRTMATDPGKAADAISAVEVTGRSTMTEMRRLVDVLREDDDHAGELEPQPGVDQVPLLVEAVRDAGLPVELVVEGDARPLSPGVDLSAYRIVQEALTNTLKHAGSARATVRLRYGSDELEVQVDDDGRGTTTWSDTAEVNGGSGHGLLGMRERVAVCGGNLVAGPRRGGGYQVVARLPVDRQSA